MLVWKQELQAEVEGAKAAAEDQLKELTAAIAAKDAELAAATEEIAAMVDAAQAAKEGHLEKIVSVQKQLDIALQDSQGFMQQISLLNEQLKESEKDAKKAEKEIARLQFIIDNPPEEDVIEGAKPPAWGAACDGGCMKAWS